MWRSTERSQVAFEQARKVLVGGVNSPVRAFAAVEGKTIVKQIVVPGRLVNLVVK